MTREQIIEQLFDLAAAAQTAGHEDVSKHIEAFLTYEVLGVSEELAASGFRRLDAAILGQRGGRAKSEAKRDAARRNGGRGGRPRKEGT